MAASPDIVPRKGTIVVNTGFFGTDPHRTVEFAVGTVLQDLDNIMLKPGEGIIVHWPASDVPE